MYCSAGRSHPLNLISMRNRLWQPPKTLSSVAAELQVWSDCFPVCACGDFCRFSVWMCNVFSRAQAPPAALRWSARRGWIKCCRTWSGTGKSRSRFSGRVVICLRATKRGRCPSWRSPCRPTVSASGRKSENETATPAPSSVPDRGDTEENNRLLE